MTPTTLTQTVVDGVTVLRIVGPLTQDGVGPVRTAFDQATAATPDAPRRLVVDLTDVPMMTTPGISMLLKAAGRLRDAGGRLVVAGAQGIVDDLLRRCRLDALLHAVSDAAEAVRVARED
jgi:stage II sporulation protein AA (anti-sigma F factor antagonist)